VTTKQSHFVLLHYLVKSSLLQNKCCNISNLKNAVRSTPISLSVAICHDSFWVCWQLMPLTDFVIAKNV